MFLIGLKTHQVLDLHYTTDEGQECFAGTQEECYDFAATQSPSFMYRVVQMTQEEIKAYPDNEPYFKDITKLEVNN